MSGTNSNNRGERQKRIQITTNFQSEADQFYERVHDDHGNIKKLAKNDHPTIAESKKVITTNPYEVECKGTNGIVKEGSTRKETVNIDKSGYDISEL